MPKAHWMLRAQINITFFSESVNAHGLHVTVNFEFVIAVRLEGVTLDSGHECHVPIPHLLLIS